MRCNLLLGGSWWVHASTCAALHLQHLHPSAWRAHCRVGGYVAWELSGGCATCCGLVVAVLLGGVMVVAFVDGDGGRGRLCQCCFLISPLLFAVACHGLGLCTRPVAWAQPL